MEFLCLFFLSSSNLIFEKATFTNMFSAVVSGIFYFHPYLGKCPLWLPCFNRWNHQLVLRTLGLKLFKGSNMKNCTKHRQRNCSREQQKQDYFPCDHLPQKIRVNYLKHSKFMFFMFAQFQVLCLHRFAIKNSSIHVFSVKQHRKTNLLQQEKPPWHPSICGWRN